MIKLLIGGSPCTYWSIAQKNNRETEPSGMGWELFKNYLIAKEKFKPDFFLYENNKSAAQAIKDQIKKELGVTGCLFEENAQGQFFIGDGALYDMDAGARYIEINSALVSAQNRQRFYVHNCGDVEQPGDRGILLRDILESGQSWTEKSYAMTASYDGAVAWNTLERHQRTCVAEPVHNFEYIDYTPRKGSEIRINENAIRCNQIKNNSSCAESFVEFTDKKAQTLTTAHTPKIIDNAEKYNNKPIYEVRDGMITIKDKQYPIKLKDGFYIIRKLTVTECCRLQTLPDDYCRAVSASQAYKGLGNGWTAEVIIHILSHALKDISKDEKIVVLSMYDGIATGRYCLDKMGFTNVKYYASEIDKFAMQIAKSNYPDIQYIGDAYNVRNDDWSLEKYAK